MASKLLVLTCAVLALLAVSAVSNPADARRGGHGGHGGHGHGFSGARHFHPWAHLGHRPHFHHRHGHRHLFIGAAPFVYGGYYAYTYGDGCYWLRRRALYTGSPYWWNRYYACIGYY